MRNLIRNATIRTLTATLSLVLFAGCEEEKPAAQAPAAAATPSAAPTPTPTPTEEPAPAKPARPEKIDQTLTDERRAAIESKYPDAKGFLSAAEVEGKLQKNKALKDEKTARAAFDKLVKGKWILFSGNAVNLTAQGFDMGIVYTPLIPGDTIGISKQWFPVTLSAVEGYKEDAFKVGDVSVVLVKYTGAGKASPGYELVATGAWK
ncbi:MAG: hypothetical protein SFV15_20560 [Polyangiaceae bacterium]|nr:hypothetical protein [Polyangiaceae bacterium]